MKRGIRIDSAAIYAVPRNSIRAKEVGAATRFPILAQRRLQLERGRTPAPRPRSLAAVARDYYANQEGPR
jgi:hypothetical protein